MVINAKIVIRLGASDVPEAKPPRQARKKSPAAASAAPTTSAGATIRTARGAGSGGRRRDGAREAVREAAGEACSAEAVPVRAGIERRRVGGAGGGSPARATEFAGEFFRPGLLEVEGQGVRKKPFEGFRSFVGRHDAVEAIPID